MGKSLTAIYEGNGILRLLDAPPDLKAHQTVEIEIVEAPPPIDDDGWDGEVYAPSAEAVWADLGLVKIDDPDVARWVAESDDLLEWNLPLDAESQ